MFSGKVWAIRLVLIMCIAVALRGIGLAVKKTLTHDETVSYIAATGHQGEYLAMMQTKSPPYGVWVTCKEWNYYRTPNERFCFSVISRDLIKSDIHPPFYFWILHLFCLVFGVTLWTGILLNIVVICSSSLLLRQTALLIGCQEKGAAFAVALWTWSPAVVPISLEARPYDLFALVAILFVRQVARCTQVSNKRYSAVIGLSLVTWVGVLTHYHFYILLLCGVLFLVCFSLKTHSGSMLPAIVAIPPAVLVGNFIHPGIRQAMGRLESELVLFHDLSGRLDRAFLTMSSFLSEIHLLQYLMCALAIYLLFRLLLKVERNVVTVKKLSPEALAVISVGFGFAVVASVLYVMGFSPPHAMGGKYLSPAWPFAAILFSSVCAIHAGRRKWLAIVILVFVLLQSAIKATAPLCTRAQRVDAGPFFQKADGMVVDNVARGELLRLIWYAPEDKRILAATQADLLQNADRLRETTCNTVYMSKRSYGNTTAGQEALLSIWPANCELKLLKGANYGLGQLFITADR